MSRLPTLATAAILLLLAALAAWLLQLQPGALHWTDPGAARRLAAALAVLLYAAGCVLLRFRHRRNGSAAGDAQGAVLVLHASQTGFAEQLAQRSAASLQAAGLRTLLMPLGQASAATLAHASQALFVVSTTGEGDAPDGAFAFVRRIMSDTLPLPQLRYGLLALGDRGYQRFCGFGHALEGWLRHQGAQPLFDLVEVDNGDAGALRHWQHHLGVLGGAPELADWSTPQYGRWRLVQRRLLNPGSPGGPVFHLALEPIEPAQWQAGDVAEVGPRHPQAAVDRLLAALGLDGAAQVDRDGRRESLSACMAASLLPHDAAELEALRARLGPQPGAQRLADLLQPLPHREYSIASLPEDGRLELLLRQMRRPDGSLGLAAGWLTQYAGIGEEIALRVRSNANFHAPGDVPLILIGNGTGIAGLRALLKQRIAAGRPRNWLLFGERSRACDYHFGAEIEAWAAQGRIARLDLAFSRDQPERRYVQHKLREAQAELKRWLQQAAAVYVCGSLDGMAPAVDAVLREVLGEAGYEDFAASGRYRRDVY